MITATKNKTMFFLHFLKRISPNTNRTPAEHPPNIKIQLPLGSPLSNSSFCYADESCNCVFDCDMGCDGVDEEDEVRDLRLPPLTHKLIAQAASLGGMASNRLPS